MMVRGWTARAAVAGLMACAVVGVLVRREQRVALLAARDAAAAAPAGEETRFSHVDVLPPTPVSDAIATRAAAAAAEEKAAQRQREEPPRSSLGGLPLLPTPGRKRYRPDPSRATKLVFLAPGMGVSKLREPGRWSGCERPCRLTRSEREADCVVVEAYTDRGLHYGSGAQAVVSVNGEPVGNVPRVAEPAYRARFDLLLDLIKDYSSCYSVPPWRRLAGAKPSAGDGGLVAVVVSNCKPHNDRNAWIEGLIRAMPDGAVHSFGRCFRTREFPARLRGMPKYDAKHELLRGYRFVLAFENSDELGYITEKPWDGLIAGAVPVVLGGGDFSLRFPLPGAAVQAREFGTPERLAEHLLAASRDPAAMARYHAWRSSPRPPPAMQYCYDRASYASACDVCQYLHEGELRLPPGFLAPAAALSSSGKV